MRTDLQSRLSRAAAAIAVGVVALAGVASSVTAHRRPPRTTIKDTTRSSSTILSSPTIGSSPTISRSLPIRLTVPIRKRRWVSSLGCLFGRPD